MTSVFNILDNRIKELAVSRFKLDVTKILPKLYPKTLDKINFKINEDNVTISCKHKDKKGRVLNPQNQPRELTVPRYIEINKAFGEILGLYYGDGTKNDFSCVEFSNSSSELIKIWMDHLFKFDIDFSRIIYKIKLSENVKIKFEISENEIINYWREKLNIPKEKMIKVTWIKTKSKPSNYLEKFGTFTINYNDSMFSSYFNTLLESILLFITVNRQFRIGFIRGLIASEGNINIRKNGSLNLVRIAGNTTRRKIYSLILWKFFRIRTHDDASSNQIYISGYDFYKKIKNLNLHTLHPYKREQFEKGYKVLLKNLKRKHNSNAMLKNKKFIAILKMLNTQPLTYGEIVKSSKVSKWRVDQFLYGYRHGKKYRYNGAIQMGLISKTKAGRSVIYNLTKKGENVCVI